MNGCMQFLVTNSIAAAVLAALVLAVTRVWRNPHVGHVLWLVVLAKLVFPPVLEVPVPAGFLAESRHLALRDGDRLAERDVYTGLPAPPITRVPVERSPATSVANSGANDSSAPTAQPVRTQPAAAHRAVAAPHNDRVPTGSPKVNLVTWTLAAWLVGSVLIALLVSWRAIRFGRAVREMLPASTSLQIAADELAARFKLRRPPQVRLTTAELMPLLWSGWRRPTIILPARLAAELSGAEVRTILAHELAHLYRRDHWVRWLEVAVTVLYWWHPAVWLARRELRKCEDICCDACVLRLLPNCRRTYAEAMFRTASLASRVPRAVPMLASSLGNSETMKGRIEMVLKCNGPKLLTRSKRVVLAATAAGVLAVSAGITRGQNEAADASGDVPQAAEPQAAQAIDVPAAGAVAGGFLDVALRESKPASMDFTSDGLKLVGACTDGVVRVWDARFGYPIHLMEGHTTPPNAVVVTPDDASAITASYNGDVFTWDLQSGELERHIRLESADNRANDPVFTQDAKLLVTRGREEETIYVWDVATGKLRQSIPLAPLGTPYGIAVTSDGGSVAVLTAAEPGNLSRITISVWDVATGEIRFANGMEGWSGTLAISSDGERLAVVAAAGIDIVDTATGDVVQALPGRPRGVDSLGFSPDGRMLAVGGSGTEVQEHTSFRWRRRTVSEFQMRDVATRRRLVSDGRVDGKTIWTLAFTNDGLYVARGDDKRIVIQTAADGTYRAVIPMLPTGIGAAQPDQAAELVHILVEEGAARNEQWLAVVRELRAIGKPAVRPLVEALDQTDDNATMRILGFALRAVGEPEAIPGLIRAIPKTLQPGGSDLGLRVDDANLEQFAQEHDLHEGERDGFGLGRPVREIFGALHKLTGVNLGEDEINFVHLGGGRRQQELQRALYQRVADRWQTWWHENWRDYLEDPALAEVEIEAVPPDAAERFRTGPQIELGMMQSGLVVESIFESESGVFLDFDTNRQAKWPESIARPTSKQAVLPAAMEEWATREGLDVVGVQYQPDGTDQWFYCLRGLGLRAWEIDNERWNGLRDEVRGQEPLLLGRPVEDGYLMHFDEASGQYDPAAQASFLFITRDGARGVLRTVSQVRRVYGQDNPPGRADDESDIGFSKGIRIMHGLIYEKVE
jgi:beta-lactamase regulating signal transducer with metallopeptidase domain/DNA-binding beta-propeller fold protein YncE